MQEGIRVASAIVLCTAGLVAASGAAAATPAQTHRQMLQSVVGRHITPGHARRLQGPVTTDRALARVPTSASRSASGFPFTPLDLTLIGAGVALVLGFGAGFRRFGRQGDGPGTVV
jgi:hypothetical protein